MWKTGLTVAAITLAGCSTIDDARDSYMGLRTKFANGFQSIDVEIAPAAAKVAKFEDVKVEANAYTSEAFETTGNVIYPKACKYLSMEVKFLNKEGGVAGTAKGIVQGYSAGEKAHFRAPLLNIPSSSRGLLSKARIDAVTCL